jgi:hypothetical protein
MKQTIVIVGGLLAGIAMASTALADGRPAPTPTPPPGLKVVLREYGRSFVLAPGETGGVSSVCLPGETVLSGSATNIPANVTLVYSSLAYDGTNSGWTIEYKNNGAEPANVYAATSALCTAGTLTIP